MPCCWFRFYVVQRVLNYSWHACKIPLTRAVVVNNIKNAIQTVSNAWVIVFNTY